VPVGQKYATSLTFVSFHFIQHLDSSAYKFTSETVSSQPLQTCEVVISTQACQCGLSDASLHL